MVNTRPAIELLYTGLFYVTEFQQVKDPVTNVTKSQEVETITGQPCRLSFKTITPAVNTDTATKISIVAKLFCGPNLTVKAGSKITVTQNGKTYILGASGESAGYSGHQEIMLTELKGWA